MSLGDCRAGVRGGSGRLGASIMAQVPSVDPELGCSGSMVLARGRVNGGHRRKAAVRRLRKTSPEWGGAGVHPVPHKSRAPARSVHPVPHKSRAPARSVQAAHRKSDGPVARGRGGRALIGRSRPCPQCGQRLTSVPRTRARKVPRFLLRQVRGWGHRGRPGRRPARYDGDWRAGRSKCRPRARAIHWRYDSAMPDYRRAHVPGGTISSRSTPIGAKPFSPMSMCARPCGKPSERFV